MFLLTWSGHRWSRYRHRSRRRPDLGWYHRPSRKVVEAVVADPVESRRGTGANLARHPRSNESQEVRLHRISSRESRGQGDPVGRAVCAEEASARPAVVAPPQQRETHSTRRADGGPWWGVAGTTGYGENLGCVQTGRWGVGEGL